jgi:hypothetical protein
MVNNAGLEAMIRHHAMLYRTSPIRWPCCAATRAVGRWRPTGPTPAPVPADRLSESQTAPYTG